MTIFLTSDAHINHSNVILYCRRPFKDVEEMNYEIIKRHNEVVGPDDTVYHLGDFSLNEKFVQPTLAKLNGTHHLIFGNHEKMYKPQKGSSSKIRRYLEYGFTSVQERMEIKLGDRTFLLCHLPYLNPNDQDQRYPDYRPKNNGQWLLHGHVHEKWLFKNRMINVGVDCWNFYPVSEAKILNLVSEIENDKQNIK